METAWAGAAAEAAWAGAAVEAAWGQALPRALQETVQGAATTEDEMDVEIDEMLEAEMDVEIDEMLEAATIELVAASCAAIVVEPPGAYSSCAAIVVEPPGA